MTDDPSRQASTSPDQYSLTIEEAAARYEHAGHPRTLRSIQRYCAKMHLDCLRQETPFGDKYLITPASVARHIAQIEELASATGRDLTRLVATDVAAQESRDTHPEALTMPPSSRDESRPDATVVAAPVGGDTPEHPVVAGSGQSRQVEIDRRYVERVESDNDFLRSQISVKDEQIKDLTERARETNHLIAGLQKMLTPLLGGYSGTHSEASSSMDTHTG
jgi:hypothetical protein